MTLRSLLIVSSIGFMPHTTASAGADIDFCRRTAQTVLRSCQVGAESDSLLALGKCENVSDPARRTQCKRQASADLKDALVQCGAQHSVRQRACRRLGGRPYDPVVDP